MEHLSNDHKDHSNQQKNRHKLCNETGHPNSLFVGKTKETDKEHDQNFPTEGNSL